MKHIFVLFLALMGGMFSAMAQSAAPPTAASDLARETTDKLVAKYTLNADQAKQMYTIQVRKLRNLNQIAPLKTFDPALYRAKVQSTQKGTLNSIRRILKNKEQVALFDATQRDVRNNRAMKQKEMMTQKADKAAIEAALLELHQE
jgi:hypothetical protein